MIVMSVVLWNEIHFISYFFYDLIIHTKVMFELCLFCAIVYHNHIHCFRIVFGFKNISSITFDAEYPYTALLCRSSWNKTWATSSHCSLNIIMWINVCISKTIKKKKRKMRSKFYKQCLLSIWSRTHAYMRGKDGMNISTINQLNEKWWRNIEKLNDNNSR